MKNNCVIATSSPRSWGRSVLRDDIVPAYFREAISSPIIVIARSVLCDEAISFLSKETP